MKAMVIIGAGASAPFGVPTLRTLFTDAEARRYLKQDTFLMQKLEEHFWKPRGISLESSDKGLTIEEILTLLRDSESVEGHHPILEEPEMSRFRKSLYILIKKAVYDGRSSSTRALNKLLNFARERYETVTWASFNWDCIFEASFYYSYASEWFNRRNPTLKIDVRGWASYLPNHIFLKLHGGVNWWFQNNQIHYLPFGAKPDLNNRWASYEANENNGVPVILEPSYYKYQDKIYDLLRPQWDYFIESLLEVEHVIIIGYSLPDADVKARTALMLAFQKNIRAKWIIIDESPVTCEKYRRLFGTTRVRAIPTNLEQFNKNFEDNLSTVLESGRVPEFGG